MKYSEESLLSDCYQPQYLIARRAECLLLSVRIARCSPFSTCVCGADLKKNWMCFELVGRQGDFLHRTLVSPLIRPAKFKHSVLLNYVPK